MPSMKSFWTASIPLALAAGLCCSHRLTAFAVCGVQTINAGALTPTSPSLNIRKTNNDRTFAWETFRYLTHAGAHEEKTSKPRWSNWSTKCDVGLTSDCPPNTSKPTDRADIASLRLPTQFVDSVIDAQKNAARSKNSTRLDKMLKDFAREPQLSSVLFDPDAAKSTRDNQLGNTYALDKAVANATGTGSDRRLPDGTFRFGSTIIKLIWQNVHLPTQTDSDARIFVYDPRETPKSDDLQNGLDQPASWVKTNYKIDPDLSHKCPQKMPRYLAPVPLKCFYYHVIDSSERIQIVAAQQIGKNVVEADLRSNNIAVLVGVHIMTLTKDNPNWRWMTFNWERSDNGRPGWNAPWNHYHLMETTKIRQKGNIKNVCFSPYLEAHNVNGLHANCINCHVFAAYEKSNPTKKITGTAFGIDDIFTAHDEYYDNSVLTGFVWSIPGNQFPTAGNNPNLEKAWERLTSILLVQ